MPPASPSGEWAHHCRGRANVRVELGLRPNKSLHSRDGYGDEGKGQVYRCQPELKELCLSFIRLLSVHNFVLGTVSSIYQ